MKLFYKLSIVFVLATTIASTECFIGDIIRGTVGAASDAVDVATGGYPYYDGYYGPYGYRYYGPRYRSWRPYRYRYYEVPKYYNATLYDDYDYDDYY